MRSRTLLGVLFVILALSAYDIVRAATVRCVRAADERRVVTVGEMDPLPGNIAFKVDAVPRFVHEGRTFTIRGTAYDTKHHLPAAAVLAVVDDERIAPAAYANNGSFDLPLSLATGSHDIRFEVVASDLTGYYEPNTRVAVVAR